MNVLNLPVIESCQGSGTQKIKTFNVNFFLTLLPSERRADNYTMDPYLMDTQAQLTPLDLKVDFHLSSLGLENLIGLEMTYFPSPFKDLILISIVSHGYMGVNSQGELLVNHLTREEENLYARDLHILSEDSYIYREEHINYSVKLEYYRNDKIIWSSNLEGMRINSLTLSSDGLYIILLIKQAEYTVPKLLMSLRVKDGKLDTCGRLSPASGIIGFSILDYVDHSFLLMIDYGTDLKVKRMAPNSNEILEEVSSSGPSFLERSWKDFLTQIRKHTEGYNTTPMVQQSVGGLEEEEMLYYAFRKPIQGEKKTVPHLLAYNIASGLIAYHIVFPRGSFNTDFVNAGDALYCSHSSIPDHKEGEAWQWHVDSYRFLFTHHSFTWSPSVHKSYPSLQREKYYQIFLVLSTLPYQLPLELIEKIMSYIPYEYDLLKG